MAHLRMGHQRGAAVLAVAGDHVEDAGREDVGGQLGQPQRGERRQLGRLQHDGVAGGQRRADLPAGHHHRVVPRRDEAGHAERLAAQDRRVAGQVLARRLGGQAAGGAGEEAEVVDEELDLGRHRRRSACRRCGSRCCDQLVGVGLDGVGEAVERRRARAPAMAAAQPVEGGGGGLDGAVDVGGADDATSAIGSPGGRVDDGVGAAVGRVDPRRRR